MDLVGHHGTVLTIDAPESPDPNLVKTVAQLGRQLALLRMTAPRPTPAHEPLTLRELSRMTGIPRSTLCNAESGHVLPRAAVVYHFAAGCGVPEEQIPFWTQARNRIAHAARYRRRAARHTAAETVVRRLAEYTDRDDLRAALDFLAAKSIDATAADFDRVLSALPPDQSADLLTGMPPEAAVACLHAMPTHHAAQCLESMDATTAASLIAHEDAAMAAEQLLALDDLTRRQVLSLLSTTALAARLTLMSRFEVQELVSKMPGAWTRRLVCDGVVPVALAADLLVALGHNDRRRLLRELPDLRLAGALAAMAPTAAAGLLRDLPAPRTTEILATMPDTKIAAVVPRLPGDQVTHLVRQIPPDRASASLADMDPSRVADVLSRLAETSRTAILAGFPKERRHAVEEAINAAGARRLPSLPGNFS